MENNKSKMNFRAATVPISAGRPASLDEKTRSVEVIAATETPVEVFDWRRLEVVNEILLMDGLEMPKSRQVPLLDSHSRYATSSVLGSLRDMRTENGQLVGRAFFSTVPEAESPFTKVREGHLTDFSIGYKIIKDEWVPAGKTATIKGRTFEGPMSVVTRWRVKELSTVPIGADENATARSAGDNKGENRNMENEAIEKARAEERERVIEVDGLCRHFGFPGMAAELIRDGATVDQARQAILEAVNAREAAKEKSRKYYPPIDDGYSPSTVTRDEKDKRAAAIIDGLTLRAGFNLEKPAPGADEYRSLSLLDIAKESLLANGVRVRGMNAHEIAREALGQRAAATADFPYLLAGTVNKVLRRAYEEAPATYEAWVNITDGRDFKEMSRNQLSEGPDLLEVPELAPYTYGTFGESKEVFAIKKYGRMFAISREAIVNDDLAAFTRIPKAFSLSAKRLVNQSVYAILTTNAAMSDGVTLFHSSHGNVGTGAAPGNGSLSEGRKLMRLQTGIAGQILNIAPRFLIVPAALETDCDQLLNSLASLEDNKNANVVNPFYRKLDLVVEGLLDATSAAAWYMAADPKAIDTIELCFLNGQRTPYLETREGWTVDGVEYKVRIEFGVKAIDWRGLFYNAGA
ncbi:MAG: hypothetical protein JRI83_13450 [Deltaproteobacteria bacterium]|nr:hypothetical protein [Deltaproteobacteria bacterium]